MFVLIRVLRLWFPVKIIMTFLHNLVDLFSIPLRRFFRIQLSMLEAKMNYVVYKKITLTLKLNPVREMEGSLT